MSVHVFMDTHDNQRCTMKVEGETLDEIRDQAFAHSMFPCCTRAEPGPIGVTDCSRGDNAESLTGLAQGHSKSSSTGRTTSQSIDRCDASCLHLTNRQSLYHSVACMRADTALLGRGSPVTTQLHAGACHGRHDDSVTGPYVRHQGRMPCDHCNIASAATCSHVLLHCHRVATAVLQRSHKCMTQCAPTCVGF